MSFFLYIMRAGYKKRNQLCKTYNLMHPLSMFFFVLLFSGSFCSDIIVREVNLNHNMNLIYWFGHGKGRCKSNQLKGYKLKIKKEFKFKENWLVIEVFYLKKCTIMLLVRKF